MSQLSRAVEQRHDKRPILSDLRESGSIEQDADLVAFLYRDDYYNEESDQQGIAEVILAKHRNGPTDTVKLSFLKRYAKFADLAATVDRRGETVCPQPSSSVRSGATRARARSSTCSPVTPTSSAATRVARTPATRSSPDGETFKLHHIPSGILYPGTLCVLGAGCVIDPSVLIEELDALEAARHLDRVGAHLRKRPPRHAVAHRARSGERAAPREAPDRHDPSRDRARLRRQVRPPRDPGSGPARREDPAPEDRDRTGREERLARASVRRSSRSSSSEIAARSEGWAARLRPYVADTSLLVDRALRDGQRVLLEGAQGTLLDVDHGTYPFVTSSNPIAGGAATGVGIGPPASTRCSGSSKAYVTRVGEGPLPTEIEGADQARMRELGGEFGTDTGRERRCGWLDLVALRFAVRVNGITSLALTKLDVLSAFGSIPVCVAYRLRDGSLTEDLPAHQSDFHHARPVYETLPGWLEPLDEIADRERSPGERACVTSSSSRSGSRSRSASSARAPSASGCWPGMGSPRFPMPEAS